MKRQLLILLFYLGNTNLFAQDLTIKQLITKAENAIFTVFAADEQGNTFSQGSGFFISAQGVGITNYHVLDGAHSGYIKDKNGNKYKIKSILDYNPNTDLVKFQVENTNLKSFNYLHISYRTQVKGEQIINISSPLGLEQTVSTGIISSIRTDEMHGSILQITAPISHGSSGSPVMDMKGNVVGIATFCREGGQSLNFAVNATQISKLSHKRNISVSQMNTNPLETKMVKSANDAYFMGDTNKALSLLDNELKTNPSNHLAFYMKGMIEFSIKNVESALSNLIKACEIGKDISFYYKQLGKCYFQLYIYTHDTSYDEYALNAYSKGLQLTTEDAELFYHIGILFYQYALKSTENPYSDNNKQLYLKAQEALDYSIKIYPTAEAYTARADVKKMIRNYGSAILDCDKAIELAPDYYRGYFTRGDIKIFDIGSYEGIVDLERALFFVLDPKEKADILGLRATAYERKAFQELGANAGDLAAKAILDYEEAYKLSNQPMYQEFKNKLIDKIKEYVQQRGSFP